VRTERGEGREKGSSLRIANGEPVHKGVPVFGIGKENKMNGPDFESEYVTMRMSEK